MIQVSIVSPSPALRAGLRQMLSGHEKINIIGEASRFQDIKDETEVAVAASVSYAHLSVETINAAVLFLTDDIESLKSVHGLNGHVWGAVLPEAAKDELIAATLSLGEGLWVFASGLGAGLMRFPQTGANAGDDSPIEPLTSREKEVLQWMAQGLSNKQIAASLHISEHTVKFHLSSLYAKLGASGRAEAVKRGLQLGLISL